MEKPERLDTIIRAFIEFWISFSLELGYEAEVTIVGKKFAQSMEFWHQIYRYVFSYLEKKYGVVWIL